MCQLLNNYNEEIHQPQIIEVNELKKELKPKETYYIAYIKQLKTIKITTSNKDTKTIQLEANLSRNDIALLNTMLSKMIDKLDSKVIPSFTLCLDFILANKGV